MGIVFNIQKFCLHDGDGIRTCVFLKGCPLRCIWCHNPESLDKSQTLSFDKSKCTLCGRCTDICFSRKIENGNLVILRENCVKCGKCAELCLNDANEIIGKEMTASQVMSEVMKDKMFYETSGGGLTVTGGEPSFQPVFTLELLHFAKEQEISSAIETCGIGSRDFYEKAASYGATFLFDIKCIDPERHKILTGADNSHILSNFRFLADIGADIIIRIPMIPDCNDSDEDIRQFADFLKENEGGYRYAEIMPYHVLGTGKSEKMGVKAQYTHANADDNDIERLCSLFASHSVQVKVSR